MIPRDFINEVVNKVDLAQFIGMYLPDLKQAGHEYKARCPFHNEASASFTVAPQKDFYHCFGCGAHGNAIRFVMEHQGKKFIDALAEVASAVGMELPQTGKPERTKEEKQEAVRYMKALEALKVVQEGYADLLKASEEAKQYLNSRGVSAESIEKFGLGYAPDAWSTVTGKRQFTKEILLDAGLATRREGKDSVYDRFRDRLMFPIYGKKNAVVGFGGRLIREAEPNPKHNNPPPKYLNSPECIVFDKGNNLYGLKQAESAIRSAKRIFVVEGYMDVVMTSQYGVENVVASLGTSVTESQLRLLFRLAERVTFCMDGDLAGKMAAWRVAENILPLIDDVHLVDFMFMPDGKDPDDFVRAYGRDAFIEESDKAVTLTDYVLNALISRTDMRNGESLARYLSDANALAQKMQFAIVKLSFQKRIAELAGITLETMLEMLKEQKAKDDSRLAARMGEPVAPQFATPPPASVPATELDASKTSEIREVGNASSPEISVAAQMLGISAIHTQEIADKLTPGLIAAHLTFADRNMLFPLLAYLKANPNASAEAITASLSFNSHGHVIAELCELAFVLKSSPFDAKAEARIHLERFKTMERVRALAKNVALHVTQNIASDNK